jgi:hypothetical protein
MKPRRVRFRMTKNEPTRIRIADVNGVVWEANIVTSVVDVKQTGVDDNGLPKFDISLQWNSQWVRADVEPPELPDNARNLDIPLKLEKEEP